MSPKDIASKLEISAGTVNTHLRHLARHAGVAGDRQLILYAMQQPAALKFGGECLPGLHSARCGLLCPYCLALRLAA